MSKPAVEAHGLRKAFGEVQALDGRENLRLIERLSPVGREQARVRAAAAPISGTRTATS